MPATIIPSFRYRNAPVAIEWLCRVFGLRKNLVVPDDSGVVAHAQLSFGEGMMMLGSVRDNEWGRFINSRTKSAARLLNPFTSSYRMPMLLTNEPKTPAPKS
jgi:uncharacterized glyoxalase superfamily protein PhnB